MKWIIEGPEGLQHFRDEHAARQAARHMARHNPGATCTVYQPYCTYCAEAVVTETPAPAGEER